MSFPDVSDAMWDWTSPITFNVVRKTVKDFEVDESESYPNTFQGILEPIPPRDLLIKPEGQRNWKWWTLVTEQELTNDWIIEDEEGLQYRVMNTQDWRKGGYMQYQITEAVPGE